MLICRLIAEGLIHKEGRYTAYEIGKRCFHELVNRSLIQLVEIYEYEKVCACRVHDTILDFIISKSIEENFVTFVGVPGLTIQTRSKVPRLSLQVEGEGISVVPAGLVLSHVRSLLENCTQFGNHHLANVGRLFQLRYLNISSTSVKELPEQIGHLRCLEILDISGMELDDLPVGIVNLRKLAHLFVHRSAKFPDGFVDLQALETLKWVRASVQSYNFLQELGQLKNLRKLHFHHWHVEQEHKEVVASSLHNLCTQNLRSLTLWGAGDSMLLNTWCTSPPLNLQKLFIQHSRFPKVPDWVGLLVNLQKLRMELEIIQHEDLCLLGGLPALLTLELKQTEDQSHCEDRKLTSSRETGFPCLRVFTYVVPDETMFDLMFGARSMPMLEELTVFIVDSVDIESSSPGALDFGIENLSSLVSFRCELDCTGIARSTADDVKASAERIVSTHPNNNLTLIYDCELC